MSNATPRAGRFFCSSSRILLSSIDQLPPEYQFLMEKFQNDKKLQHQLDIKLGDNKEGCLCILNTHKPFFRQLRVHPHHNIARERRLEEVLETLFDGCQEQVVTSKIRQF